MSKCKPKLGDQWYRSRFDLAMRGLNRVLRRLEIRERSRRQQNYFLRNK